MKGKQNASSTCNKYVLIKRPLAYKVGLNRLKLNKNFQPTKKCLTIKY